MTKVLEEDITHTARSNTATAAQPGAGVGELIGAHGGEDPSWLWAVEGVAVWVGCV